MVLNAGRVGHRYPGYRYEVGREKVREYAIATGHGAQYLGDDEGLTAPPLFAAAVTAKASAVVLGDPELRAHRNLVHGAQRYEFHRPVRVGDVLRCRPSVLGLAGRQGMERLSIGVACMDATTGEPVLDATVTIVFFDEGVV